MSMTEFGFLLSELMEKRSMDAAALATALAGRGYEQAMSIHWLPTCKESWRLTRGCPASSQGC